MEITNNNPLYESFQLKVLNPIKEIINNCEKAIYSSKEYCAKLSIQLLEYKELCDDKQFVDESIKSIQTAELGYIKYLESVISDLNKMLNESN